MSLALVKRGEDERKRKRQEKIQNMRILYSPPIWSDMKEEKERDPNALQVVTRVPSVEEFQEERRGREIQERKEKRETTHTERRGIPSTMAKIKQTLADIFSPGRTDVFFLWEDHPEKTFLHLKYVDKIFKFLKKELGQLTVTKPVRDAIQSYLYDLQKKLNLSEEFLASIFHSLNVMFFYKQYFFIYLPTMLSLWRAALRSGQQTSKELEEIFEEFKDWGFPPHVIRTLPVYLDDYLAMNPDIDANPDKIYFIEEVNDYVHSLSK